MRTARSNVRASRTTSPDPDSFHSLSRRLNRWGLNDFIAARGAANERAQAVVANGKGDLVILLDT
jgi:hypothetical protein